MISFCVSFKSSGTKTMKLLLLITITARPHACTVSMGDYMQPVVFATIFYTHTAVRAI